MLGKGAIFGFDLREKASARPYNGMGGGGPFFLSFFFNSTVTSHHDGTIITTDACMDGIFLYSIVLLQDTYSARGERRGRAGSSGLSFLHLYLCWRFKRGIIHCSSRSARLCSIAMANHCKVIWVRISEFPSRERGTDSSLENRGRREVSGAIIPLFCFWFFLVVGFIGLSNLPTYTWAA